MSIILALTTALLLIGWGVIRSRKQQPVAAPVLVQRYVHAGHAWLRLTDDGDVLVGIDDFAQSVIGNVEEVRLPRMFGAVKQGRTGWFVRHGSRVVPIVSPVSGRVIQKNEMAMHNPSLVNSSPYGDGWLLRIRPRRLPVQLSNLFAGRVAMQWQDLARAQLARMFSGTPALMFQDGGVVLSDLADRCSDAEWQAIEREVFLATDTF
jgi:glycine cleavage system H protein